MIGDNGAKLMAESLLFTPNLEILNLGANMNIYKHIIFIRRQSN